MANKRMGQGQNRKLRADFGRDKTTSPSPAEKREVSRRHGSSKKPSGATAKTKSMLRQGRNASDRKLASDHGRAKQKSGGEAKKTRESPRGTGRRSGSSKAMT